nr:hypothetical protein Iba_chr13aCG0980 [Ipomoea batatas]GMD76521.1 hypothetical protein Iba_chr13bCG11050 [Ipomoea batatas]
MEVRFWIGSKDGGGTQQRKKLMFRLKQPMIKAAIQVYANDDQQFTLAERMAKALAVMKCLDWNFLVVNGDIMAIPGLYKLVHVSLSLVFTKLYETFHFGCDNEVF